MVFAPPWRKRYGELEVSDVRRLRELEQENARLKRLVAERDLEIDVMCGGERRRSAHTGLLRRRARVIAAPRLLPLSRCQVVAALRSTIAGARCEGDSGDARAVASVSAIRISTHPSVFRASRFQDERATSLSTVARSRPAAAQAQTTQARGERAAQAAGTSTRQSGLGL